MDFHGTFSQVFSLDRACSLFVPFSFSFAYYLSLGWLSNYNQKLKKALAKEFVVGLCSLIMVT